MKQRILAAMMITATFSGGAVAFDNIEADVYYDGPLKDQIEKEYAVTLAGLDAQAKSLGVEPRKKDIETAKNHFATKAVMMARCLDTALSTRKMAAKSIDVKKQISSCVETHLAFMTWMHADGKVDELCILDNHSFVLRQRQEKPVYEFLKTGGMFPGHFDVIALRECHMESQKPIWERKRPRL